VSAYVRAAPQVAAEGTDPDLLTAVVAWLVAPRRGADGLRRRCAEIEAADALQRLHAALPAPSTTQREAAELALGAWRRLGVRAALVGDPAYPSQLAAGWPATPGPVLLSWLGQPPVDAPTVAVVGARRATGYGTGVASWLAATVARAGVHVISGGARGIDAAAHRAALEEPGGTSVVLGCGHAVGYPRDHAAPGGLFDQVLDHGGSLLSELLPDAPPHAGNVRARNRIVAGLSHAVVVVEGGGRSGALLTAGAAADRGVPVLAVPGDVRAPGSVAPHELLAEGAAPCRGPGDVLETLGTVMPPVGERGEATGGEPVTAGLPQDIAAVLAGSWPRPVRVEELARRTGRSVPTLLGALTQARLVGTVAESVEGVRLCRAPSTPGAG
jgi:DNA processing protein